MKEVCIYCGTPRDDRQSCCGENHWEKIEEEVKYDPPMTETEEYLLRKQGLEDFNNYWKDLD